ncbi:proline racemase family protein [Thermus sediminis]|uniref:proline racemase family protein n=1 Tax=Thermus sediminis TaxID=1761908 RepID=UPI000E3C0A7F|nr:proline racemase family protein [Thermus sediminis]
MAAPESIPWSPPSGWVRLSTLDLHTEGEPLRILASGLGPVPGATMLEKRRYAQGHLEGLRRLLILEPRGHADMYGAIVTEPTSPNGDLGVLFLHNEGWSTMCGHGIIALVTGLLETGLRPSTFPGLDPRRLQVKEEIRIDTPAGQVLARPEWSPSGHAARVAFRNVPSFAYALDEVVDVPGLGRVRYDLAFGGAFYAYVDATELGLDLEPQAYRSLIEAGMAIKRAVIASREIRHPLEPDLGFLYGTIFGGPPRDPAHQARNVCVFAEGEVDRSPTGTGVSGRAALEWARGRLRQGQPFTVESLLGTTFTVTLVEEVDFQGLPAVVPEVSGRAWITGRHEFLLDPEDPLSEGFLLR